MQKRGRVGRSAQHMPYSGCYVSGSPSVYSAWPDISEMFADVTRYLLMLGGDPTQMPKIMFAVGENRGWKDGDGILEATMAVPPEYRLKVTDYVVFTLETPGVGGYYAERSRYFFFQEPHEEIRSHFEEALKLQEFQINAYKNGMTMQQLRDTINAYKASVGAEQTTGHTWMDTEIRGMGNLTVCRPLINCEWEMFPLAKGMVFDSIHKYKKGHRCTRFMKPSGWKMTKPHFWELSTEDYSIIKVMNN